MHPIVAKELELKYAKELGIPENLIDSYPKIFYCSCDKFRYHIPRQLMFRMMLNQKLQGNKPNSEVFINNIYSGTPNGGFYFSDTKEGTDWYNFIADYRVL